MVFLLILALCSLSVVSANEDMGVDMQLSMPQSEVQMDSNIGLENYYPSSSENTFSFEEDSNLNIETMEADNTNILSNAGNDEKLIYDLNNQPDYSDLKINNVCIINEENSNIVNDEIIHEDYSNLNIDNTVNSEASYSNEYYSSDIVEINENTIENSLNERLNASNGYVMKNNGNLLMLPLTERNLNTETNRSLKETFYENKIELSGNNDQIVNYWSESLINELSSNFALIKESYLFGFISNQRNYNNYPQIGLPLEYASNIFGVSRDIDDNAFTWNKNPDEKAYITVDMVNKSTDEILDLNLNEKEDLNKITPFEIGVNASLKALDYFKSQGIDIPKDYPYLYVLTSAGQVKLNQTGTSDAIMGILSVLGLKLNKNIYSIHIPKCEDLIFYYLWVNSTDKNDALSYALKYDTYKGELIESEEIKKQCDSIVYNIIYRDEKHYPNERYVSGDYLVINNEFLTGNLTDVNETSNSTNSSVISDIEEEIKNSVLFSGNPYNILFTVIAIFIVSSIFVSSYTKQD
ncbi:hypothetical protein [Methanobrevibacter sp.]|uniref:hypothetical protein n=1 Tax=Methanobrevibacter sp. TaxID=66852 RepID=UPI00388E1E9B